MEDDENERRFSIRSGSAKAQKKKKWSQSATSGGIKIKVPLVLKKSDKFRYFTL